MNISLKLFASRSRLSLDYHLALFLFSHFSQCPHASSFILSFISQPLLSLLPPPVPASWKYWHQTQKLCRANFLSAAHHRHSFNYCRDREAGPVRALARISVVPSNPRCPRGMWCIHVKGRGGSGGVVPVILYSIHTSLSWQQKSCFPCCIPKRLGSHMFWIL